MTDRRVHAFTDDALGRRGAVELAKLVRDGEVTPEELAAAAITRARQVDPTLHAVAYEAFDNPRYSSDKDAALYGVPTFVKDNRDVTGMPTNHGTEAFRAKPAKKDGPYVTQLLSSGVTVLGKSRLPEFGFSASTEFRTMPPTGNPWNPEYSVGASSGGAAALVAAGVVPIAHANDGGGSIRIPAACAGLVGLKQTRHRHIDDDTARKLPINMTSEGVLTRSVRDTAAFVAAMEDHWRNPALPPIGAVDGPADRRLRVGLLLESPAGAIVDEPTRDAVLRAAALLEQAGHVVEPISAPVTEQFVADFLLYWAMLADLVTTAGKVLADRSFDADLLDGLTRGLHRHHRARLLRTPGALRRLRQIPAVYAMAFARHELILSPVLAHPAPPLGYLSPNVAFDELLERLTNYVAFTPLNNIAGTPAISMPLGLSAEGVPLGIQLSGAHGDERTLLEVAYTLEAAAPFESITS